MAFKYIFLFLSLIIAYYACSFDFSVPKKYLSTTDELIRSVGYEVENHTVEVADGILITVFRMLPPKSRKRVKNLYNPVLIEGGLFCSSDVNVMAGPNRDLSFLLLDSGLDVWLGNNRDTRYSSPGPKTDLHDPYLKYKGFHEWGLDFAATIDHILNVTGQPKVHVILISMGSPAMLTLLASQPKYNDKIGILLHFGPSTSVVLKNLTLKIFFWLFENVPWFFVYFDVGKIREVKTWVGIQLFVKTPSLTPWATSVFEETVGLPYDNYQDNKEALVLGFSLMPSGTPMGAVAHFMQFTRNYSGFRMRDYGVSENIKRYNSLEAPLYNLTNINVTHKLYFAGAEKLGTNPVNGSVYELLSNVIGNYTVPTPFEHGNFFINAIRDPKFVKDVINTLQNKQIVN